MLLPTTEQIEQLLMGLTPDEQVALWRQLMLEGEAGLGREERIARALSHPLPFAQTYLPEYLFKSTPEFHLNLYNLFSGEWRRLNPEAEGVVLAAPRGHAKSTLATFIVPLWSIYAKRKRFMVLSSNTDEQSFLYTDAIKREIEENTGLLRDFGNICGDRRELRRGLRWTQKDFTVCHQDGFTTRVVAKGTGSSFRGLRVRAYRPDLIICDDIEDEENTNTDAQRQKVWRWLTRTVIPMLDPDRGELFIIGTIVHYAAALNRLLSKEFADIYVQQLFQAIQKDGTALWPDYWPLRRLERKRKQIGSYAFNQEYMNIPLDPETRPFRPEWFGWYNRGELEYRPKKEGEAGIRGDWYWRGEKLAVFGGVDLAISDMTGADYFAYVVIGVTRNNDVVLMHCHHDRIDFPAQVAELIHLIKNFPFRRLAIETNAYQRALAQQLLVQEEKAGRLIKQVQHKGGDSDETKYGRILATTPLFENGKVYFPLANEGQPGDLDELGLHRMPLWVLPLYQELTRFPKGENDDLADAWEMAQSVSIGRKRGFEGWA